MSEPINVRDPQALAALLTRVRELEADRDSWRRVAERLEREKDAFARRCAQWVLEEVATRPDMMQHVWDGTVEESLAAVREEMAKEPRT